jgi:hypothetical protein
MPPNGGGSSRACRREGCPELPQKSGIARLSMPIATYRLRALWNLIFGNGIGLCAGLIGGHDATEPFQPLSDDSHAPRA